MEKQEKKEKHVEDRFRQEDVFWRFVLDCMTGAASDAPWLDFCRHHTLGGALLLGDVLQFADINHSLRFLLGPGAAAPSGGEGPSIHYRYCK